MVLYHGSNVIVEQPKIIRQNRYLEYGIYGYITKYFEALHTMGDRYIVQDIDDYIDSVTENGRGE